MYSTNKGTAVVYIKQLRLSRRDVGGGRIASVYIDSLGWQTWMKLELRMKKPSEPLLQFLKGPESHERMNRRTTTIRFQIYDDLRNRL